MRWSHRGGDKGTACLPLHRVSESKLSVMSPQIGFWSDLLRSSEGSKVSRCLLDRGKERNDSDLVNSRRRA